MIPTWKIKRELGRVKQQFINLPGKTATYFFGARYYDLVLAKKRRLVDGQIERSAKRAVYLIYPANGLLKSHLRTLKFLADNSISTTVVSNLPLSAEDEAEVLKHCHVYIERANFGYDFGGYRDGVLSMKDELAQTKQLILMNDSVWFPLYPDTDWLEQIDALGVDYASSVSSENKSNIPKLDNSKFNQGYRPHDKLFHYGSFSLAIGPKILAHPGFLQFWKSFPLSNKKKATILRGEIGLTTWVRENGFTHDETFGVKQFDEILDDLSNEKLVEIASHMIIDIPGEWRDLIGTIDQDMTQVSKSDLLRYIRTIVDRKGAGYSLAYYLVLERKHPFLKKSPVVWADVASKTTLKILENVGTDAAAEALEEALVAKSKQEGT